MRCARCRKPFQALEALYDDYPDARRAPSLDGDAEPPEVGRKPQPRFPAGDLAPPALADSRKRRFPLGWALVLGVLAVATTLNLAWTFRAAIPPDSMVAETLQRLAVPGFEPPAEFRDPTRIHLLTRDIHDHPTRRGILVLSATFINLADQAQPYPQLTVSLKDPEDRVIAARRFAPADYLAGEPGEGALLAPGQQVPVLLEFGDPGERATGFELGFQ